MPELQVGRKAEKGLEQKELPPGEQNPWGISYAPWTALYIYIGREYSHLLDHELSWGSRVA